MKSAATSVTGVALIALLASYSTAAALSSANSAPGAISASAGRVVRTKYGNLRGVTLPGTTSGELALFSPLCPSVHIYIYIVSIFVRNKIYDRSKLKSTPALRAQPT